MRILFAATLFLLYNTACLGNATNVIRRSDVGLPGGDLTTVTESTIAFVGPPTGTLKINSGASLIATGPPISSTASVSSGNYIPTATEQQTRIATQTPHATQGVVAQCWRYFSKDSREDPEANPRNGFSVRDLRTTIGNLKNKTEAIRDAYHGGQDFRYITDITTNVTIGLSSEYQFQNNTSVSMKWIIERLEVALGAIQHKDESPGVCVWQNYVEGGDTYFVDKLGVYTNYTRSERPITQYINIAGGAGDWLGSKRYGNASPDLPPLPNPCEGPDGIPKGDAEYVNRKGVECYDWEGHCSETTNITSGSPLLSILKAQGKIMQRGQLATPRLVAHEDATCTHHYCDVLNGVVVSICYKNGTVEEDYDQAEAINLLGALTNEFTLRESRKGGSRCFWGGDILPVEMLGKRYNGSIRRVFPKGGEKTSGLGLVVQSILKDPVFCPGSIRE
ncbi:hypothetical protein ABW19_dt0207504 [Dactylella cylindrospora]|nr:hypothetical protein ABW19_dt0207504 [Dactylella cylindrospora]